MTHPTSRRVWIISGAAGLALVGVALYLSLRSSGPPDDGPGPELPTTPPPEQIYRGKRLPEWLAQLKSAKIQDRADAVVAIAEFGPAARDAAPALIAEFKEHHHRIGTAYALAEIDPDPGVVVPFLISALRTPAPTDGDFFKRSDWESQRAGAADVAGRLGVKAKAVVPALVEALPTTPRAAVALARLGPDALPAVEALLADPDPVRGARAARVLGLMGPTAKGAVPGLGRALEAPNPEVRTLAFKALSRIGPEAIPTLQKALGSTDAELRLLAIQALRDMGRQARDAIQACAAALKDPDLRIRAAAAEAVVRVTGETKDALPVLVEALQHTDYQTANRASAVLESLGPGAREVLPALLIALEKPKGGDRHYLIRVIGRVAPAETAVPLLIKALDTTDRSTALQALADLGPSAAPAVPALRRGLKAWADRDREHIPYALGQIGPAAKDAVPDLLGLMRQAKWSRDRPANIMWALGNIGTDASEALPDLLFFQRTSDAIIRFTLTEPDDVDNAHGYLTSSRRAASFALGRIGPEGIKALIEDLRQKEHSRRIWALRGLAEAGPGSEAAGSALRTVLDDPNPYIRTLAARALWRIEKKADDAVPVLVAVLRDHRRAASHDSYSDAESALEVLGEMGPAAAKAAPEVVALLQDGFSDAAYALCQIQPGTELGLAFLRRALERESANTFTPIARIGRLGPLARPLVPALVQSMRESDYSPNAASALREVDPDAAADLGVYR